MAAIDAGPNSSVTYSITELAELSGMAAHTLRWYERIGLLGEVDRGNGGRRKYTSTHLGRLELITMMRDAGMSLSDLAQYVALADSGEAMAGARRQILEDRRERLRTDIDRMAHTLRRLDDLIDRCDASERGCPLA